MIQFEAIVLKLVAQSLDFAGPVLILLAGDEYVFVVIIWSKGLVLRRNVALPVVDQAIRIEKRLLGRLVLVLLGAAVQDHRVHHRILSA